MAQEYFYGIETRALYPIALKARYVSAGTWPQEGFEVDNETAQAFRDDPERGANVDTGYPGKKIVKNDDGTFDIVVG